MIKADYYKIGMREHKGDPWARIATCWHSSTLRRYVHSLRPKEEPTSWGLLNYSLVLEECHFNDGAWIEADDFMIQGSGFAGAGCTQLLYDVDNRHWYYEGPGGMRCIIDYHHKLLVTFDGVFMDDNYESQLPWKNWA